MLAAVHIVKSALSSDIVRASIEQLVKNVVASLSRLGLRNARFLKKVHFVPGTANAERIVEENNQKFSESR